MRKCFEMGKAKWTGLGWLGGAVALLWAKKLNHMLSVLEILIKKKKSQFFHFHSYVLSQEILHE